MNKPGLHGLQGHTPGPWKIHIDERSAELGDGVKHAYIDAKTNRLAYVYDVDRREGNANAQLIAAAPELLEACEAAYRLLEALRMDDGVGEILTEVEKDLYHLIETQLSAAIAKAEGEGK